MREWMQQIREVARLNKGWCKEKKERREGE